MSNMRIVDTEAHTPTLRKLKLNEFIHAFRKASVFRVKMTPRKVLNIARSFSAYILRQPQWIRYPIHMKIDVAPSCQLRCPVCPHSVINDVPTRYMPPIMKSSLFRKIVDEVKHDTVVLSLYNLGEPLLNPHIADMANYAAANGLSTYLTSNLSLPMSDEFIDALASSGLNLLIVAVDGLTDKTFGQQRIRGNLTLTIDNLHRLIAARNRTPGSPLKLCLQYIVFDFNRYEKDYAIQFCQSIKLDELHFIHGETEKWAITNTPRTTDMPRSGRLTPHCAWPYFSMVVNSTGGVTACCKYRMDEIYLKRDEFRAMGNAAQQSIKDIFATPAYTEARNLSANPRKAGRKKDHFCDGCGIIYDDAKPVTAAHHPVDAVRKS